MWGKHTHTYMDKHKVKANIDNLQKPWSVRPVSNHIKTSSKICTGFVEFTMKFFNMPQFHVLNFFLGQLSFVTFAANKIDLYNGLKGSYMFHMLKMTHLILTLNAVCALLKLKFHLFFNPDLSSSVYIYPSWSHGMKTFVLEGAWPAVPQLTKH